MYGGQQSKAAGLKSLLSTSSAAWHIAHESGMPESFRSMVLLIGLVIGGDCSMVMLCKMLRCKDEDA